MSIQTTFTKQKRELAKAQELTNVLLTVGGLLVVLFVGWKMPKADVFDELTNGGTKRRNVRLFNFFYFLIRYVAPVGVAVLILSNLL